MTPISLTHTTVKPMKYLPVHVPQKSSQARRETVQVVPDALDEGVGQSLELGHDEVPVLLHVLRIVGCALAAELLKTFRR